MIPLATLEEVPRYQASKWLKLPLLLSMGEMERLFELLPDAFVLLSGVLSASELIFSKKDFLDAYKGYLAEIRKGIKRPAIDRRFTSAITSDLSDLRSIAVQKGAIQGGLLVRIYRPVIQIQPYTLYYSEVAGEFREMTHSLDSFYWGLLFSMPQLFENPLTHEVEKLTEKDPNMRIFKELQRFSRMHTVPTPFQVGDRILRYVARIGKELLQGAPCLPLPQK